MRIPKMNTGMRSGLLGLGMFMIALSTAAEFATLDEADDGWTVTEKTVMASHPPLRQIHACRPDQKMHIEVQHHRELLERLQSL